MGKSITYDGQDGAGYPPMGAVAAKFRGANAPGIPGFIALADSMKSDIWGAGQMGSAFEPVKDKPALLPFAPRFSADSDCEKLRR